MDKNPFPPLYQAALGRFLAQPDEQLRQDAYSLGRQALDLGLGLLDLAQLHAQACGVLTEGSGPIAPDWLSRAAEFFAEAAAPFEMELRGYREALDRNEALLQQASRVETLGRLVGGVVHDFNNLLGIIGGFTELALEDPMVGHGSELEQNLQETRKAGHRAADLTRQLLAFTRNQSVEARPLNLNAVAKDTVLMLKRLLGANVELALELAPQLWPVMADPGQMAQVLMNLAINARDAMPEGGKITLHTENVDLANDGPGLLSGRYVQLTVTDTGSGMDPATQARIFEPFFTTKAAGAGTGLGLATVARIIKLSGGTLGVESEPGHGSNFKALLPACAETASGAEAPTLETDRLRGQETLLLVENDDSIRRLAAAQLKRAGYRVIEASQASEALQIAVVDKGFPLLLTDLSMPGMGGLELARKLRAARPGLKVLFVSGSPPENTEQPLLQGPGTDFLAKPYASPELLRRIRALLDQALP